MVEEVDGVKLAYADPPYPGQAKRHYSNDPSGIKAEEVDSVVLLQHLSENYDGFALSTSEPGLILIMGELPKGYLKKNKIRIAPWVKMWAHFRPWVDVQYAHEYVLFRTKRAKGSRPSVRDFLICNPSKKKGTHGAKPPEFNDWILNILGYQKEDTLDDLYPGTGGMSEAIQRFGKMPS